MVAAAKGRGVAADHVTYLGKGGWQDRNLASFALDNDYLMVTNNRRHFLREYAKLDVHGGLVVIVPAVSRASQQQLFAKVLDLLEERGGDLVNKLVEVLANGEVRQREWTKLDHDIGHTAKPAWD